MKNVSNYFIFNIKIGLSHRSDNQYSSKERSLNILMNILKY